MDNTRYQAFPSFLNPKAAKSRVPFAILQASRLRRTMYPEIIRVFSRNLNPIFLLNWKILVKFDQIKQLPESNISYSVMHKRRVKALYGVLQHKNCEAKSRMRQKKLLPKAPNFWKK